MAQMTEEFARRIYEDGRHGKHSPLTAWEESQLAWAWLRFNGHQVPAIVGVNRKAMEEEYPFVPKMGWVDRLYWWLVSRGWRFHE